MMVWQRMIGLVGGSTRNHRNRQRRRLKLERLDRREVLAANIGAIAGIAFTDQADDGLTSDDPRLEDVAVELYLDDGSGNAGSLVTTGADADTLVTTTMTADASDPEPGLYRFDDLAPGDYWVVQAPVAGLESPPEQLVSVNNDGGVQIVQIDDYSLTAQSVNGNSGTPTEADSAAAPEAVGGARDIQVNNSSGVGQLSIVVDSTNDQLSIGSQGDAVGDALIQYDGDDDSITLDAVGLGGVSLGGGVAGGDVLMGAGIHVVTRAQIAGDSLVLNVFTTAIDFSTITVEIPADDSDFIEAFLPFSDFQVAGGTGADFNNVGAIEASVALSANNDVFVSIVETLRPDIVMLDLVNIQPIELGGELFLDNGTGGGVLNNSLLDTGEPAVPAGTTVELYQVAGPDDSVDVGVDTPIATTTTAADGTYSFADLDPGNYVVVVPETNFASGGNLAGFGPSTGIDPPNDPDDGVDGDSNGSLVAGLGVASGTITLVSNSEPTDDADQDPNTNTTLDFGFVPQVDLAVTKTLNASSEEFAGGTAIFDFEVTNNGPLEATNVTVEDVLPSGLTFDSIQNASGTFTDSINGSTVTVELGSLGVGATATFQLVATIAAAQAGSIVNPATVSTADQVDVDTSNNTDSATIGLLESDLQITMTDGTDPVSPGSQLVYTVTVTNDGPDDATGVEVLDELPDGVTFVSGAVDGDGSAVSIDQTNNEVTAVVGALAASGTSTITITVTVDSDAASLLTNVATVSLDPDVDPDPTNNSVSEETTVDRAVDVAIEKTVDGDVSAGGLVTYVIEVTNNGPSDAQGVMVTDTLASELTFDSFDAGSTGVTITQSGQDLTFDVGTLATTGSLTFSFTATLAASATGTVSNSAAVTTTDTDSDTSNNSDTTDTAIDRDVDLVIEKTVDVSTAVPGQDQLVYTFTVSHDTDSLSDAVNVEVSDILPAGLSSAVISAANADLADYDPSTNVALVRFNSLAVGQTETFTITVDVDEDATGSIVNTATVSSDATDLDASNNTDDATTNLTPEFDLTVTKTVDDATPGPGDTVTYAVEVTNDGPSTATGVLLTDAVPTGLTFVSGTFDGTTGSVSSGTIGFPEIVVDAGETVTGSIVFTVNNTTTGTVTNTANVTADAGETDTTNNSGADDIEVTPMVDLEATKSVDVTQNAQPGSELTYTVIVTNNGPSDATNVQVVDTLPAGVTFISGSGPNGETLTVSGGTVTVNGGTIADGDDITFTIIASVNANATGNLVNSVVASSDLTDSDTTNDQATVTTSVDPESASISGSVYLDANGNGTLDTGETGIANVTIRLTGVDAMGNAVDLTTTTDEDGLYAFEDLAAGTYDVTETQPSGFRDGDEESGTGATATVGDDVFSDLALAADASASGFNFAELNDFLSKRRFLASTD